METDDDWSTVAKGKTLKAPQPTPEQSKTDPIKVCWASLFETPRRSPLSRPKSPEVSHSAALKVIASVQPIFVSWKQLQGACRMRSRGMHNNGNMCFLNSVLSLGLLGGWELNCLGSTKPDILRPIGESPSIDPVEAAGIY